MSGGRSRNTLLTVCFLLDLETAAVWTALSDSLVVSASNGVMLGVEGVLHHTWGLVQCSDVVAYILVVQALDQVLRR